MSKTNNGYSKKAQHHHDLLEILDVQADVVRVVYRVLFRLVMIEMKYSMDYNDEYSHDVSKQNEFRAKVDKRVQSLINQLQ